MSMLWRSDPRYFVCFYLFHHWLLDTMLFSYVISLCYFLILYYRAAYYIILYCIIWNQCIHIMMHSNYVRFINSPSNYSALYRSVSCFVSADSYLLICVLLFHVVLYPTYTITDPKLSYLNKSFQFKVLNPLSLI